MLPPSLLLLFISVSFVKQILEILAPFVNHVTFFFIIANGTSKVIEIPRVQSNVIVDQVFAAAS